MKDKKAANKLIKRAKANPDLYTDTEVKYAKLIKRTLKLSKDDQSISQHQSK
jgi:hypothetical protein|tara:strand:- start:81 stop:236 length:156 start_codon:yes stop_codon:yes gene_type:complete